MPMSSKCKNPLCIYKYHMYIIVMYVYIYIGHIQYRDMCCMYGDEALCPRRVCSRVAWSGLVSTNRNSWVSVQRRDAIPPARTISFLLTREETAWARSLAWQADAQHKVSTPPNCNPSTTVEDCVLGCPSACVVDNYWQKPTTQYFPEPTPRRRYFPH